MRLEGACAYSFYHQLLCNQIKSHKIIMLRNKSSNLFLLQNFKRFPANTRQVATEALLGKGHNSIYQSTTNISLSLIEKLKSIHHQRPSVDGIKKVSIYRIPEKLRKVDPKAYDPHFISIGPYHHGSLKASEKFKWQSLKRLLGPGEASRHELDRLIDALKEIEHEVRGCYSDHVHLSKDELIEMMLLDGCFIIELFRELNRNNFTGSSLLSKRWMLPVVRRDVITLENQIPMVVLRKLFEETKKKSTEESSLEELALRFFDPLMPRSPQILKQSIKSTTERSHQYQYKHLLDLFHSSISLNSFKRGKEPHMYRSVSELKETGIKVRLLEECQPLELRFEGGFLRMPCLRINDHSGSFFRNILAYEQCDQDCKPDMTTYLFFLDKLINSTDDVALLHYEGVIQHSLGSNKQVAKLVNNLCIEVEHDGYGSYLFNVVEDINSYADQFWVKAKTRLKHDYFSNMWVSISTLVAALAIYAILLQLTSNAIESEEKKYSEKCGWWAAINLFLVDPPQGFKKIGHCASSFIVGSNATEDPPSSDPQ